MGNYNRLDECTGGVEWFADQDSAFMLDSDTKAFGLVLEAATNDTVSSLSIPVCAVWGAKTDRNCVALEVFDITDGMPVLSALTTTTYLPGSDIFNVGTFAYGPYTFYIPVQSPIYPALANPTPNPGVWPNNSRPVEDDSFTFAAFGSPYEYAFGVDGIAGMTAGRWISRLRFVYTLAMLSEGGDKNTAQFDPYLMWRGQRYPAKPETIDTDGNREVTFDWYIHPAFGRPWLPDDLDEFDTGAGSNCGFGFNVHGTGSSNVLANVVQARLDVESAPTDERIVVGQLCPRQNTQGWQFVPFIDIPTAGDGGEVALTAGRKYLFLFRRSRGGATAICRIGDPHAVLPGPPNWTAMFPTLDRQSHRINGLADELPVVAGIVLRKAASTAYSLDSQPYASTSPEGLDTQDAWPEINAYFRMSPVDTSHWMRQEFTPANSGDYGWLRVNVALAVGKSSHDLLIQIRRTSDNTPFGAPFIISPDELRPSKLKWQTLGKRITGALASLVGGTQYYFDISSGAPRNQGWLVQVLNAGQMTGPPGGPPVNAIPAMYGEQNTPPDRLTLSNGGSPLEYTTADAEVNIATVPDPPTGFSATNNGEQCCIDFNTINFVPPTIPECGGLGQLEVERSDDGGETWRTICAITDPSVTFFDDYESLRNREARYRARAVRADGVPSDYTAEATATAVQTCCGLILTSNESPELTVFYPDLDAVRQYDWPEPDAVYAPHDRNFQIRLRRIEDLGSVFKATVKVRSGRVNRQPGTFEQGSPCFPNCNPLNPDSDWTLEGEEVFGPLKAIARADLSYVCVHNEHGNRWLASIRTPSGSHRPVGEIFTAPIEVIQVGGTYPSTPDSTGGGS